MIRRVTIRRFKRFDEVVFDLPGHVVLAGPNNTGKTTLLQAIAAWDLAVRRWLELHDRQKHGTSYAKAPIARQAFLSVPLRNFDLLWTGRSMQQPIEIEVQHERGWQLAMEIAPDTTEQAYVRPRADSDPEHLRSFQPLEVAFVPPLAGVQLQEPLYANWATLTDLLARFRSGDVLRNLLVHASRDSAAWAALTSSIHRLFGYELLLPEDRGPYIQTDYRERADGPSFDLASAGSGFQQALLLLAILHTHPNRVLLLDEPDAHLHAVLQDALHHELRSVAARQSDQLVIATHSEVILNRVDLAEIRVAFDPRRPLIEESERRALGRALQHLDNFDVLEAHRARGVLYIEDTTDLEILRAFARVLGHPAADLLVDQLFWKRTVVESAGGIAVSAKEHHEALRLVRPDLPGLMLVDGDAHPGMQSSAIVGKGLQCLRWKRYEIESYLFHPEALARFCAQHQPEALRAQVAERVREHFREAHPPAFIRDPLGDAAFLESVKARTKLLPPALTAGELPGFRYTQFHEIAAQMLPAEIHPEVTEKLDLLCRAFGVSP